MTHKIEMGELEGEGIGYNASASTVQSYLEAYADRVSNIVRAARLDPQASLEPSEILSCNTLLVSNLCNAVGAACQEATLVSLDSRPYFVGCVAAFEELAATSLTSLDIVTHRLGELGGEAHLEQRPEHSLSSSLGFPLEIQSGYSTVQHIIRHASEVSAAIARPTLAELGASVYKDVTVRSVRNMLGLLSGCGGDTKHVVVAMYNTYLCINLMGHMRNVTSGELGSGAVSESCTTSGMTGFLRTYDMYCTAARMNITLFESLAAALIDSDIEGGLATLSLYFNIRENLL